MLKPLVLMTTLASLVACQTQTIETSNKSKTSSVSVVQHGLQKAADNADYNSIITLNAQGALKRAKEIDTWSTTKTPLQGKPFVVKDNIHVAGLANTGGTPSLKNFVPTQSNEVVERLQNAGAIVLAKANMHELAFGITSNNAGFGTVKNAVDDMRIAGGSSGGTAVAIALGIVDMGLGTDTGGSTRIPAVLNGIAGFRPSMGRYPSTHVTPVSATRDTIGPMAKDVDTIALMDAVITNTESAQATSLSGLRLGVPRTYFYQNIDPDVLENTEQVLLKLRDAGVELIEVDLPNVQELNTKVSFPVVFYEVMQQMPAYLKDNDTDVSLNQLIDQIASPDVSGAFKSQLGDSAMPKQVYQDAIDTYRPQLQAMYKKVFADNKVQALIMPATPLAAAPIKGSDETVELNGKRVPTFPTYIQNTDPSSNAGIPSLVLPSGRVAGLPVGIMLDGPADSDTQLLSIGMAIESLLEK